MARSLDWRELRPGLIGAATVATMVIGILFFARVGQLRGDTATLYVYSDDADGVLPGTEVWLSGEVVGQVKRVLFRDASIDTLRRLTIEARIIADRMHYIRRDVRVDIRPGGNLIGSPVINITGGTANAPAVENGDTLAAVSSNAFKPLGVRVSALGDRMTMLTDTARRLAQLISSAQGTLGAFNRSGMPVIPNTIATAGDLVERASKGDGTVGLAIRNDLAGQFARLMVRKDSLVAVVSSGDGNIARLRNDSTLQLRVAAARAGIDSLRLRFSGKGTFDRARTDSALSIEMARMSAELALLIEEFRKNPKAFIAF